MKKDLIVVLYGSTGDLSFRKLLPAFTNLKEKNLLPEKTLILALGRRDFTNEDYFEFLKDKNSNLNLGLISDLVKYHKMEISQSNDYILLKNEIDKYSSKTTRVIHYLSVAPELMLDVVDNININNVVVKDDINTSIIFEKPFGTNYKSANDINKELWLRFNEDQIYRIDHYLGKQIITDLIDIRFNNLVLSPILKCKNVKEIQVSVKESVGILNRGSFYDLTGASKDMFQSHIMQIITLLLMNKPKNNDSKNIIDQKVNVIKNLKFDKKETIFGQYSGYLNEENVSDNSTTETLLKTKLIYKGKFKKIPIKVLTGKKMNTKETFIKYTLKDNSEVLFTIYPEFKIEVKTSLNNIDIKFDYNINNDLDEYAKLLLGAIKFKKEMFVRWDEIEESWKFVDALLETKNELVIYTDELK